MTRRAWWRGSRANLATAPQNMASALSINDKFWLENLDKLSQRFNAWVAK